MLINRLILLFIIIASGVFVSNYGGNITYALFYMSLSIPIVSFIYTFYVYIRFRLYQNVEQRIVVKGDLTSYSFTIANEDLITFRSIKVNFISDKSKVMNAESITEYCLLPNSTETMTTQVRCHYRGEYYIGANSVDIVDFLYLFRITYPVLSKLKVTVLPRIVPIDNLSIAPAQKDSKNLPYISSHEQEFMDIDTRKYQYGDNLKQIHWKVSAKRNELFSRNYSVNPKSEIIMLMDLTDITDTPLIKTITEDQIIEGALSIANYCVANSTVVKIYYDMDGIKKLYINRKTDFDLFYQKCIDLRFSSKVALSEILEISQLEASLNSFFIILTHRLDFSSYMNILKIAEKGFDVAVLLMSDHLSKEEEDMMEGIKSAGIELRKVTREDEIGEVLNS